MQQLKIGELSKSLNAKAMRVRYGEVLSPRSKAVVDRIDPDVLLRPAGMGVDRAAVRPRACALGDPALDPGADRSRSACHRRRGMGKADVGRAEPRAGEDLPKHGNSTGRETETTPWYPLELVRAVALLWLFAGLRVDEILRLRVGAIRWQTTPDTDGGERVCLLDVPTNKTTSAFTKPVDPLVGDAIEAWQAVRPPQPRLADRKTGELVDMLLAYRGAQLGSKYINRVLVPLLCRKAGVPGEDMRGQITSHRARATIATQLYNAKDPMTLLELQAWLGHSNPSSTQHYARITPMTLTKAYTDAGYFARNVSTIEVLIDRDAITNGTVADGGPFEFYDLGHGYCTYTFFEQCPHRMACARCDFYLPKESSQSQLLEASEGSSGCWSRSLLPTTNVPQSRAMRRPSTV